MEAALTRPGQCERAALGRGYTALSPARGSPRCPQQTLASKLHAGHAGPESSDARPLHRLSDVLGEQQDLQLLRNLVRAMPPADGKARVLEHLRYAAEFAATRPW